MEKSSRIFVAGHRGLVGSAIMNSLNNRGYRNIVVRAFSELDLTDQKSVDSFFEEEKPEYVFLAAAMVGGIQANNTLRADFIYQNIMIQSNVVYASWKHHVRKILFLGSTCIYPKNAPQPLIEDYLLTSALEFTNEPYAIAKIAGMKMCESFNIQYNTNFLSVMPTNLYGPADNYDLEKSHVLPALMRKIHLGKSLEEGDWDALRKDLNRNPIEGVSGDDSEDTILAILDKYGITVSRNLSNELKVTVEVWGTGTPLREFMHSADMAEACVFLMEKVDIGDLIRVHQENKPNQHDYHPPHFLNIGTGEEISIRDLALKIKELVGFRGDIVFNSSKPDGTMRKTIDVSVIKRLGYRYKYNLTQGLTKTYADYVAS
jgi:GDP-L-fucose synthase